MPQNTKLITFLVIDHIMVEVVVPDPAMAPI